ncbi:MAG: hypothetical protein ACRDHP_14425 [Ktedonobacterales bacterium]
MCGTTLSVSTPAANAAAEDGLPPWLRELQGGPPASSGYGQPPAAPYGAPAWPGHEPAPRNMQASDLVSADALPDWLRNVASGPLVPPAPPSGSNGTGRSAGAPAAPAGNGWGAPAGYGQPGNPPDPRYLPGASNGARAGMSGPLGGGPRGSGALGFGQPASTLFDEAALPNWLRQASMGQEMDVAPPGSHQAPGASPAYPGYGAPGGMAMHGAEPSGYNGYQLQQNPQAPAPRPPEYGQRNQPPPQSPAAAQASAFPSIEQAGAYRPAPASEAGISGRSLLDPSALPAWMGGQPASYAPSATGMPSNPGGMSAQSLVDEAALPQWLRAEPNVPAAPPPPSYGMPGAPGAPPPPRTSSWLAAPVSAEPLPQWLNQVYADANVARMEPRPAGPPMTGGVSGRLHSPEYGAAGSGYGTANYGGSPANGSQNLSGGTVSASDFVDESALPDWLKSQGAVGSERDSQASPYAQAPAALPDGTVPAHRIAPMYRPAGETSDGPPAGFAASDLIDPSALPSWVASQEPAPEQSFSSASGWTVKQPAASPRLPANGVDASSGYLDADDSWQSGNPSLRQSRPPSPREGPRGYNGAYGRMPDPEVSSRSAGNGIGKRRDAPIPHDELPPWLQGAEPVQRGGAPHPGGGMMGGPGNARGWDNTPQGVDPQWSDWDDDPSGANEYSRHDSYAQYDDEPEQERRGGLRRFFRRK